MSDLLKYKPEFIFKFKNEVALTDKIKNRLLFSTIDKSLTIIGVKTANGMYLNEFLVEVDNSFEIIPDIGINLIKKVIIPHIIIPDHIIFFYPIYLKLFQPEPQSFQRQ